MRRTRQRWLQRHLSAERTYTKGNIQLKILPGVFHPGYFYSTGFLLKHLQQLDLKGKKLLELGCGSGLISISTALQGAIATASDINRTAIEELKENAKKNGAELIILHSDLFASIPSQVFDIIVVNPPYFKKDPVSEGEYAWYCGMNLQYFSRLFGSVKNYMKNNSKIIMILTDDCDMEAILAMGKKEGLHFALVWQKWYRFETNFIYHITRQ